MIRADVAGGSNRSNASSPAARRTGSDSSARGAGPRRRAPWTGRVAHADSRGKPRLLRLGARPRRGCARRRLDLPPCVGGLRARLAAADGGGATRRRYNRLADDERRRPRSACRGRRGVERRARLGGGRCRPRSDVSLHRPRRASDGDLLRERVPRARGRRGPGTEEPAAADGDARGRGAAPRPRERLVPRDGRQQRVHDRDARVPHQRAGARRRRAPARLVAPRDTEVVRSRLRPDRSGRDAREAAPCRIRRRRTRVRSACRGRLPRCGSAHRGGAGEARRPADVLPLRVRARRQPHRGDHRRASDPRRPTGRR